MNLQTSAPLIKQRQLINNWEWFSINPESVSSNIINIRWHPEQWKQSGSQWHSSNKIIASVWLANWRKKRYSICCDLMKSSKSHFHARRLRHHSILFSYSVKICSIPESSSILIWPVLQRNKDFMKFKISRIHRTQREVYIAIKHKRNGSEVVAKSHQKDHYQRERFITVCWHHKWLLPAEGLTKELFSLVWFWDDGKQWIMQTLWNNESSDKVSCLPKQTVWKRGFFNLQHGQVQADINPLNNKN